MKKTLRKFQALSFSIILLLSFSGFCKGAQFYVSLSGNDHNPGTIQRPFASLERAQQQARGIKGSIIVYIRGGTYYLSSPVIFTEKDTRKSGEPLVFKNYPGEKVIISSSAILKLSWENYNKGIMQAKVNKDITFDELFIDGQLQRMARYPNYNKNIGHYGGFAADAISPKRVKGWQNPKGGYIHALHQSEWGDFSYRINGKDTAGNLTMEGGFQNNRPSGMHKEFRFVENIFEELDTAGEWYFDKTKHVLYFYPPAHTDLNKAVVQIPQLESLFEFEGSANNPVKNISLRGLEFTQTLRTFMKNKEPLLRGDWTIYRKGTVTMGGTEHCSVKDCYFNSVGGNAIVFTNYNRNDEIAGCHIANAGSSGIVFAGDPKAVRSPLFRYEEFNDPNAIDRTPGPKSNNYPANCLVYNNLIENIGQVEKQVAGVEISMSMNIKVIHNTIDHVPRAGININDGTWGGHEIAYNDVFNTVLETGDHGAFNSWGRDRYWFPDRKEMDSIVALHPELILLDAVKPVAIHNNRFRCDHGWDIDLDDGSSNYQIYNNVLLNGGLKLREGFDRKVYNNIIINNSFHPHVWFKNSHDSFTHNLVSTAYYPINIIFWGDKVDDNFFPDEASLKKARQNGTDLHSLFGNALYVNAATGNYTIKPGSAVFKTGFKNFEMNQFGVVSPSLKKMANKVTIPAIVSVIKSGNDEVYEFLGAKMKNLRTLGERSATGMASETGVLVLKVPKSSILYGKVLDNDVILKFNGVVVNDIKDLLRAKMDLQLTHTAKMGLFRNQGSKEIEIPLK